MAKRIGNWMIGFGCLGVFLALFPSFFAEAGGVISPRISDHLKDHPDAVPSTERYTFGWVGSPLVSYQSVNTITEEGGAISVSRSQDFRVGWLSWSSLTLGIAGAFLWAGKKLTAKPKEEKAVTCPG